MAQTSAILGYVGTYTQREAHVLGTAEGIYRVRLDMASGAVTVIDAVGGVVNPSFLALDPSERYLYAVNEVQEYQGERAGAVTAFAIDPGSGTLTCLNEQSTHGPGPCHLSVDETGACVVVSNYNGGSVTLFRIEAGGRLAPAGDFVQHVGTSVNPQRQQEPHAHSITVAPGNRFALVADLGTDHVVTYRLDLVNGKLIPNDQPPVGVAPGSGPRHLAFHPNGRFVYVIHELDSTLGVFAYDGASGTLTSQQRVTTLPDGFSERSHCADVHVTPSGRFVYGSNRGHDSIAMFAIDQETGLVTPIGHEPTQGRTPRNFAIDPTGTFLLAANQNSDTVVTFRIDPQSGVLAPTGQVASIPTPVCIRFRTS